MSWQVCFALSSADSVLVTGAEASEPPLAVVLPGRFGVEPPPEGAAVPVPPVVVDDFGRAGAGRGAAGRAARPPPPFEDERG